jgi:formylglycine-generating enzyme
MKSAKFFGALISLVLIGSACGLFAQDSTYKNSVGMEFILVQPGTMQVGVFAPTCPDPNAPPPTFGGVGGPGGASVPQPGPGGALGAPAGGAQDGPAGTPGAGTGRGRGRGQQDPRAAWTPADYAKCNELAKRDAAPGFPVTIKKAYYLGKFEVTQAQWKQVMGANLSVFQGDKVRGDADRHPVESVTWTDTQTFVKKLNALEKTKLYHLPSEFEWEYACRAGGPGQQSWNDIRQQAVEGGGGFGSGPGPNGTLIPPPTTAEVGSKKPNAWGFYDMLGNVWEWVQDPYNDKMFPDQVPAKVGSEHVLKGGGFASDVKNTICATHGAGPGDRWAVGFRVEKDAK